jgi:uncharacterized protein YebE (UPF0316 family)
MKELMNNPYWSSLIVFSSQIIFIYLRTLNMIYTTDRKIWPSIFTGAGVGMLTLISFSIGIKSVLSGEVIPIVVFLVGGAVGTYLGIKQNEKNENK